MKIKAFLLCAAAALTLTTAVSFAALPVQAQTQPAPAVVEQTPNNDEVAIVPLDYTDNNDHAASSQTGSAAKKKSPNWVKITLISLGISLAVTGITVFIIRKGYKQNGMTEPYEYTKKAPLELTDSADELVDVRVTSRTIERN